MPPVKYLAISLLALLSSALPIHALQLTPDNFANVIADGLYFIEFFSPFCGHCRNFAPTWNQLVEETEQNTPSVKTAQVDCALHGDLCDDQNVKGYPTMHMYHNGKFVAEFSGRRDLPDLHAFIKQHANALGSPEPSKPSKPAVNVDGQVLELSSDTFATNLSKGPMFVKFFAPWCGHCKKLAPVWRQLAKHMQGKLIVAEVDCEAHSALCKAHDVQGYPTLVYITSGGLRSEYNGGRKLEQLKSFAVKASSDGVQSIRTDEIGDLIEQNEVMYLLIHSGSNTNILDTIKRVSPVLLGSPTIFTSSDPALLPRFKIPQTNTWALVAFKDHDLTTPSSILSEHPTTSDETIRTWLLSHRLPTTIELTQDTFQSVMSAPQAPLVVIAATSSAMKNKVEERLIEVGKKWRTRTKGSGLTSGREVIFSWMDVERWAEWMKSMYGIVVTEEKDLDDIPVVITDHKRLVYYDKDTTDSRIKITSSPSLFATVEAAGAGKLTYKHSENTVERLARYLNQKMTSLERYVVIYPWRAAFFLFAIIVAVFMFLKRTIANDVSGEYRKVDRLD